MERLTIRNADGTYSQPTHTTFEKMFYKLAEFEDFLEEQGFKDLESFKWTLNFMKQLNNVGAKTLMENQTLKDRWQKLKEFVKDKNIQWTYLDLLDKIQELEGGSNVKN